MAVSRRALFGKLDLTLFRAIESATAFAKLRGNPYVELTHWLHQLWQLNVRTRPTEAAGRCLVAFSCRVEHYDEDEGKLQVFFLPNEEIKVYVFPAGPQNPEHPSHMGYPKNPNLLPEATER